MTLKKLLPTSIACTAAGILALFSLVLGDPASSQSTAAGREADAQQAEEILGKQWVRVSHDKRNRPQALEVAIVRYVPKEHVPNEDVPTDQVKRPKGGEWVDLVGAVHIGDRSYYKQLNKRFREYDAVLYELVAPEGTIVDPGQGTSSTNPLGAMQNGMKSMLEIEHQLEQIDYTRANFVHADLSPSEFMQSMKSRDEGFMKLYFRMMGQAIAQQSQQAAQGQSADLDLFSALVAKDRPRMLKIALANQFDSMEAMIGGISGPDGSTLITVRNKRALEVLKEEQGKGKKKLAIFYGAGHLSEMHEELVERFGMKPVEITWLEAWDLRE